MEKYQEFMGMAGLPGAYYPMMQLPATQLESMYPKCYYIIYPRIKRVCDSMCQQAQMMAPNSAMMQQAVDNIYDEVEPLLGEDDMMEMDNQMMQMPEYQMPMQEQQMPQYQMPMYEQQMPQYHMPMYENPMHMQNDMGKCGCGSEMDSRQFTGAGFFPGFFPRPRRRFLRDLISILLIRQLLRRPFGGFGGFGF